MPFPFFLPGSLPGSEGFPGSLSAIGDLCSESLDLLIAQYEKSERLHDLICSYLLEIAEIDTATLALYLSLDPDAAQGVHLDRLGLIVGELREGRSDPLFALGIKTRILINRSNGRIADLTKIARTFLALTPTDGVKIGEVESARIELRVYGLMIQSGLSLARRLIAAKAAGVALTQITMPPFNPHNSSRAFTLIRAGDYPEKDIDRGLEWGGGTTVPGGYLQHALG